MKKSISCNNICGILTTIFESLKSELPQDCFNTIKLDKI